MNFNFLSKHSSHQIVLIPAAGSSNSLLVVDGVTRLGTVDMSEKTIKLDHPERDIEKVLRRLKQWGEDIEEYEIEKREPKKSLLNTILPFKKDKDEPPSKGIEEKE